MTEPEAVRYTLKGVYLTARKDENGCLLIARADQVPSHSSPAVKIQPNPSAGRAITSGSAGKWWFKLFNHPESVHRRPFGTADTLEKAEETLLEAARREAAHREAAALASASVEEAEEILGDRIDRWLEDKRSEGDCEG